MKLRIYKKKLKKHSFLIITILVFLFVFLGNIAEDLQIKQLEKNQKVEKEIPTSVPIKETIVTPLPTKTPTPNKVVPEETNSTADQWGVAKQLDEHTWTMKIGQDDRMATLQEILEALNAYRQRNGRGALSWDDNLAAYAQSRAEQFVKLGSTDKHAGFNEYLKNEENYKKLGFRGLGENSSFGFRLVGVHLIEWVYAGDKPHDDNQLSSSWSSVGIGVSKTATDLIFGGSKF